MKKGIVLIGILSSCFGACDNTNEWVYKIAPNVCYADAFYVKPDFQPNSYKIELSGNLNQDVLVTITTTHLDSEKRNERRAGSNYFVRLKKGPLDYSTDARNYVDDDIKVVVSGYDTLTYPNPESKGTRQGMPLGDIKIRITLN